MNLQIYTGPNNSIVACGQVIPLQQIAEQLTKELFTYFLNNEANGLEPIARQMVSMANHPGTCEYRLAQEYLRTKFSIPY